MNAVDKYEYKLRTEQMLEFMDEGAYRKAAEIADTIDWHRVKNVSMLASVGDIYEKTGEYSKSYDVLKIVYDRADGSRKIVYKLGLLALRLRNVDEALDYYEEFVQVAPKDPNQYILRYKILRARRAPIEQQIEALEEFKKAEYIEKWAYELAKLYQEAGMTAECLEECDDLILWFSEGEYVFKAMELKMQYKPLTPSQQEKYDHRFEYEEDPGYEDDEDLAEPVKEDPIPVAREVAPTAASEEIPELTEETSEAYEPEDFEEDGFEEQDEITEQKPERKKPSIGTNMSLGEALSGIVRGQKKQEEVLQAETKQIPDVEEVLKEEEAQRAEVVAEVEAEEVAATKEAEPENAVEQKAETKETSADDDQIEGQMSLEDILNGWETAASQESEPKEEEPVEQEEQILEAIDSAEEQVESSLSSEEKAEEIVEYDIEDYEEEEYDEEVEDYEEEEYDDFDEDAEEYEEEEEYDDFEEDAEEYEEEEEYDDFEEDAEEYEEEEEYDDFEEDAEDYEEEEYDDFDEDAEEYEEEEEYDDFEEDAEEYEEEEYDESEEDAEDYEEEEEYDESEEEVEEYEEEEEYDDFEEDAEEYEEEYDDFDEDAEDYEEDYDEEEYDVFDSDLRELTPDGKKKKATVKKKPEAKKKPVLDDREIEDDDDFPDLLASTAPLSRKETAKLIATGKTAPLPLDEISNALSMSDTGFIVHGRYDLETQSGVGTRAGLTEEQKKLFSYFVPVRGMSEQLVDVLEQDKNCTNRQGTSRTGNLLIIGRKGSGKTVLAVDVVKAIQRERRIKQGKVAIVTGDSLNKKKMSDIFQKLYGGALIIEKAGKMNERTVAKLNKAMEEDTGEMLIVLEEQRKPLDRLLSSNREFRRKFTSRLEVPIFINDELVTFGQTYARENGYKIDEMGILALYSRIDALQREDHAVTVAEVKEVMDDAIAHSQKSSAKRLVKRVFGRGTDSSDRIILSEKDFNI
ncbi:AAA family ATPase [Ruminococcus sp. AF14-10]|nr:AAA family ATPase [Ruminococcus sp. AF14-10]